MLAQVVVCNLVSNDVPVTLKCLLDVCVAGGQRLSFGMHCPLSCSIFVLLYTYLSSL